MSFGQSPVPMGATPEELLQAQVAGGAPPPPTVAPTAQPAAVPVQIAGVPVSGMMDASGGISAPEITTTTTKDPSHSTTKVPETQKITAAESQEQKTRAMAEEAQAAKTAARVQEETFRAEQVDRENELLKQQMADTEAARKSEDAKVAAALTELRARQQDQSAFKPSTFRESMGTFRMALSALGQGLGAYGASMTGGPNTAYQIFANQEAAYREQQKQIIDQKAAAVETATGNVRAAQDFRNKALAAIDEKYLAKNKYLQNLIEGKIKRIPKAAAEGQAELAKLRTDYDKTEMETAQRLAGTRTDQGEEKSTTNVNGKSQKTSQQVTEGEGRAAMYAMRMKFGIDEIKNGPALTPKEFGKLQDNVIALRAQTENATKGMAEGPAKRAALMALGLSPDSLTSGIPDDKKPAALGWLTAAGLVIRNESGAAISLEENITNSQKLIPNQSDGPKSTAAKLRALEQNQDLMLRMAGPEAYKRMTGSYPPGYGQTTTAPKTDAPAGAAGPRPAPGQTAAQKQYAVDTAKQILDDANAGKRDFSQERKDIARARSLLKGKSLSPQERDALDWADKNPRDPKARAIRSRILGAKGGE